MPRPLTDRGKGAYWTVNDNVDPRAGVQRVRKKKPRGPTVNGKQNQANHDAQLAAMGVPVPGVGVPGGVGMPGVVGMQFNQQLAAMAAASPGAIPQHPGAEGDERMDGADFPRGQPPMVYPQFP